MCLGIPLIEITVNYYNLVVFRRTKIKIDRLQSWTTVYCFRRLFTRYCLFSIHKINILQFGFSNQSHTIAPFQIVVFHFDYYCKGEIVSQRLMPVGMMIWWQIRLELCPAPQCYNFKSSVRHCPQLDICQKHLTFGKELRTDIQNMFDKNVTRCHFPSLFGRCIYFYGCSLYKLF